MLTLKIQLVRPRQIITLELIEGRPLLKGTWRRVSSESNTSLRSDDGLWENWPHGIPGGVRTVRLYDSNEVATAHLCDYLCGRPDGVGRFVARGFGAEFGDEEFSWRLVHAPDLSHKPLPVAVPDVIPAARGERQGWWKGY